MIVAAADGSSLSNPGPSGWAWYIDDQRWAAGGWPHGTNNMGELMAVLDLLRQTGPVADEPLQVLCDSQYVINAATKWMPGWKRKGWRKADGKPVLNVDLLKQLDAELAGREVRFAWVKGHAGHELNEAADLRARAAATAYQQGHPPDAGPGFGATGVAAQPVVEDGYWPSQDGLFGLPEAEPSDVDVVWAQERELLTDQVRADAARMAALLHPDFVEHGASGRMWTRDEALTIGPNAEPVTLEPLAAETLAADLLLLRWISRRASGDAVRCSLWQQTNGRWRLRFHQGTRLAD